MNIKLLGNMLRDLPAAAAEEWFETLLEQPGFRLERIVSHGHVTPEGSWYDQPQDEWVLLLSGAARLVLEGNETVELVSGDTVLLPAGCRHRVAWTDPDLPTVWLALHYKTIG